MTLNFVVPIGIIRFVIFDDREGSSTKNNFFDVTLSENNYQRITIPPGVWIAFRGVGSKYNLLLNLANLEHNPTEVERKENLSEITFKW
jgi:dTDP-4-dehydrorhamnose 3,5-epimerase